MAKTKKELIPEQRDELLNTLRDRFEKNMDRHKGLDWHKIHTKLEARPENLWTLDEMEVTGGEPNVVGQDKKSVAYLFVDCSSKSPQGRRSLCSDRDTLESVTPYTSVTTPQVFAPE